MHACWDLFVDGVLHSQVIHQLSLYLHDLNNILLKCGRSIVLVPLASSRFNGAWKKVVSSALAAVTCWPADAPLLWNSSGPARHSGKCCTGVPRGVDSSWLDLGIDPCACGARVEENPTVTLHRAQEGCPPLPVRCWFEPHRINHLRG